MDAISETPTGTLCPACGTVLPCQPHAPGIDIPCPECGYLLWCRMKVVGGVVILYVVPEVTPEHADVEHLCERLTASDDGPCVVFDLSDLDLITSALTARLIAVNKRIRAAKGKLILCGLCPFVLETFQGSRLDRVFNIANDEQAALASF